MSFDSLPIFWNRSRHKYFFWQWYISIRMVRIITISVAILCVHKKCERIDVGLPCKGLIEIIGLF